MIFKNWINRTFGTTGALTGSDIPYDGVNSLSEQIDDNVIEIASQAEVDAGTVTDKIVTPETLANKAGTSTVVSTGSNANGYYREWSDGYKEQWGTSALITYTQEGTVTFPIPFTDVSSLSVRASPVLDPVVGNFFDYGDTSLTNVAIGSFNIKAGGAGTNVYKWSAQGY